MFQSTIPTDTATPLDTSGNTTQTDTPTIEPKQDSAFQGSPSPALHADIPTSILNAGVSPCISNNVVPNFKKSELKISNSRVDKDSVKVTKGNSKKNKLEIPKGKAEVFGAIVNRSVKDKIGKIGFEAWADRVAEIGSVIERSDLLVMLEYQEEMERRANPLAYFVPNGKIEEFVKELGNNLKKWIFLLSAANSLGKSAAAIVTLGNIIWRSQSEWFKGERFEGKWPYPKKCWYVSESATLKDFVCGTDENASGDNSEVRKWFPKGKYTMTKGGVDYFSRLTTTNGWTVAFKTYDQDPSQFESDKIGVLIFDEPPPQAIFKACMARLTLGGVVIMAMTPLTKSAWVAEDLVPQATPEGAVYVLYADCEDNCQTHGVRGRLKHQDIERLLSQYDQDEIEARAHGRFMHLSGLIFKGLRPEKHLQNLENMTFTQEEYKIFNVVDPHDGRPPAIVWFAVDKFGRSWAVDEYPKVEDNNGLWFHQIKGFVKTTKEICEEIKSIEKSWGWDGSKIVRVMDPNFGNQQQQTVGMKTHQYYAKCGREIKYPLRYRINVNNNIEEGHRLIRDNLTITENGAGDPLFVVSQRCQNLWYHLTHYTKRTQSAKKEEMDGVTDRVMEKYKDYIDVLRYFLQYKRNPQFREEVKKELEWHEKIQGGSSENNYNILDPFHVRNSFS